MDKTVDSLYDDAIALVQEATGLALVIRGDENGPQPTGEYASLLLIAQQQKGLDAVVYSEIPITDQFFGFDGNPLSTPFNSEPFTPDEVAEVEEVSVLVSSDIFFTFSLQFFRGSSPMEHSRKMFKFAQTPWGADWLTSRPFVLKAISDPTSTNYEAGKKWIKRSSQQMVLAASSEETRTYGVIKEVSVVINKDETHTVTK